jgi:Tfp pilus assembly PilM family ATPase/Tfp pilus assembly protein PilN
MANLFKGFFTPRYVVGLELTPTGIGVAQIINTLKGADLGRALYKKLEEGEDVYDALGRLFQEQDLKYEMLVTCIPGSSAIIRQITLPIEKPAKLEKILKYQMEPHVPYPIEEMIVDFQLPEPGEPVTAVAAQKKVLSQHLSELAQVELKPDLVSCDDTALLTLYLQTHKDDDTTPVAIIHLGYGKVSVQMIREKRLDFIRIFSREEDVLDQISKTFRLYRLKRPETPMEQALLIDREDPDGSSLPDKLSSLLEVKTTAWRPFDSMRHKLGSLESDLQGNLCVPLGLALSMSNPTNRIIDFRKEDFRTTSALDLRRMLTVTLSLVLLLACVFTFNVFYKLHIQQARFDRLNNNIRKVFTDTFPSVRYIVKGQELVQMKQKIGEESQRFLWLDSIIKRGTVLELISNLTKTVSGFPDVMIENITVEGNEISMDGSASSFETVDRLKEKLSNTGTFNEVKLAGAKTDKRANVVRFNFGMEKVK